MLLLLPDAAAAEALLSEKIGALSSFEALTAVRAYVTTVLCFREGMTDMPLRFKGGRVFSIVPWECEDCLAPRRKPRAEASFVFRREGRNMSIYWAA